MLTVDPSDGSAKATEGVAFGVIVIIFDAIARVPCTVVKLWLDGNVGVP
jgi:fructose-1,6-bisphosphatase